MSGDNVIEALARARVCAYVRVYEREREREYQRCAQIESLVS